MLTPALKIIPAASGLQGNRKSHPNLLVRGHEQLHICLQMHRLFYVQRPQPTKLQRFDEDGSIRGRMGSVHSQPK